MGSTVTFCCTSLTAGKCFSVLPSIFSDLEIRFVVGISTSSLTGAMANVVTASEDEVRALGRKREFLGHHLCWPSLFWNCCCKKVWFANPSDWGKPLEKRLIIEMDILSLCTVCNFMGPRCGRHIDAVQQINTYIRVNYASSQKLTVD